MSSPPIILLRGILREQRHWGAFADLLEKKFPERIVTGLDLAGNGPRCNETSPDTVAAMVDDLRSELRRQIGESNGPIDLLAISMGGMIALEWMSRYPEEVRSALILNTSANSLSPFYERLRWQRYGGLLRVASSSPQTRESLLFTMTSNIRPLAQSVIDHWIAWRKECPVTTRNAMRQLRAAARYRIGEKPGQPIRILCGGKDRLVDSRCSRKLADYWGLPIAIHPKAGHDLPLDAPEWVCQEANEFIGDSISTAESD